MSRWKLPNNGFERYILRRVVFPRPFTLGNAPEVYPAGVYDVETKEQPLEAGGHTAYVRTATVLIVPTVSGTCSREVRSSELDEAMLRDRDHGGPLEPSENPDARDAGAGAGAALP
ncbi:MAG: hypothetical protein ACK4K7_15965 [Allosphingosinicella sp.]|uniref:hypothetical protein n=1 Tax=Allosphingosinicella sp. TaxID=2823234 RepID=UPI0039336ABF